MLVLATSLLLLTLVAAGACGAVTPEEYEARLREFLAQLETAKEPVVSDDFYYGYDADDLADMNGFTLHHYDLTTVDGYVLDLWRLNDAVDTLFDDELAQRPPVLISPGLGCDGTIFMNNQRNNSMAYMIFDDGYDVWIVNYRGNFYSKKHTKYNRDKDVDYWYFTMHEQARYDLTASIDFVLEKNEHDQLTIVGHSMGSADALILLTMHEEFGFDTNKVKAVVATAPALISEHMTAMMFDGIHDMKDGVPERILFDIFGKKALAPHETFGLPLAQLAYRAPKFAIDFVEWSCGPDETNGYEGDHIYYYVNFYPSGTSVYTLAHYFQLIKRGGLQAYDYSGVADGLNTSHYGTAEPPVYDLNNIPTNIPILLIQGETDTMAALEDTQQVYNILNSKPRVYLDMKTIGGYNHIDFMWSSNVDTLAYPLVKEFLEQYATD